MIILKKCVISDDKSRSSLEGFGQLIVLYFEVSGR